MLHSKVICPLAALFAAIASSSAKAPPAGPIDDRAAVERVYYEHRRGTKPPFEEVLPRQQIERLVKLDDKKEAVLRRVYGIEISEADVAAEVHRINVTTRAPEILAQIKSALGDDAKRFGATVARPALVERELRSRFENDDKLHAQQRHKAEDARRDLLRAEGVEPRVALLRRLPDAVVNETTWQFAQRPARSDPTPVSDNDTTESAELRSANYSIEATVSRAVPLDAPAARAEEAYFEDLDPELQRVLRAQLRNAGDVSAVIETPAGFLLFVAQSTSPESLRVASVEFRKRDYDKWLHEQPD